VALAVTGCGQSHAANSTYELMQMNLCLSGLAGCYDHAVVGEAVARIRGEHPDAVTFSEACSGDVAEIARLTGYRRRFSKVVYGGKLFRCVKPGGRGVFGDALLTRAPIESSENQAFKAQQGIERRRWLCVSTRAGVEVCTAHLNTREPEEVLGNIAQCAELRAILARRAAGRTLIFGGDVNRVESCAPAGFWVRTDRSAHQDPELQQVYGRGALHSPSAEVIPTVHTDHSVLVVTAQGPGS
jgi:endonuclease/exonuclease/phosphatase family metal-dependent hydrolase